MSLRRKCAACGEVFARPATLIYHRNVNGDCRPANLLAVVGMTYKAGAWDWAPSKMPKKGSLKT